MIDFTASMEQSKLWPKTNIFGHFPTVKKAANNACTPILR
jgi:hypothetical protein